MINSNLCLWKSDLVQQLFLPHEASRILGTPLSIRSPVDRVVWAYTPSGLFTTSSAYKLLTASATMNNVGSSNFEPQKKFWRGLVATGAQQNQAFYLESLQQCSSSNGQPFPRHISTSELCEICNGSPEDVLHAFWQCKDVKCVWNAHSWFQQAVSPPRLNFCVICLIGFCRLMMILEKNSLRFQLGVYVT